eukprot:scaffold125874_cov36-Cyclotella_meneghiniana.AAC.3
MNAYPERTVREICGALPISIHAFPKQLEPNHKHIKGKSQPKKPSDTLSSFVKKMITENNNLCSKYKSVLIKDLTKEALLQRTSHGISGVCDHAFACVPRSLKQSSADEPISYGVTILLHRTCTTITKSNVPYESLLRRHFPNLFPLESTKLPTIEKTNNEFTTVTSNRNNNRKQQSNNTDIRAAISALDSRVKSKAHREGRVYLVLNGMGGRRAVDLYDSWDGPFQAKQLTQGVSGSKYYSFDDINDAWARLQQSFPFLTDRESIRQWHKTIPHTETNLSPTYSNFDGPHHYRKLAEAYTFTEMDDEEMIYFL